MRKILTLSIVALCAAMTSCVKTADPDPMAGGSNMYISGTSYYFLTLDPSTIALRLNALLIESNNAEDLNAITEGYKTKLFGNATFTRTGNYIRISFPSNYIGADRDESRTGDIVVNTGGVLLNTPGAIWSVAAPTIDKSKAYRRTSGSFTLYHEWDAYQIEQQGDHFTISFTNFMSYYVDERDQASKWNGTFTIQLSEMTAPGYEVLMNQARTIPTAEASGTVMGGTATITYKVLQPLEYGPKEKSWYSMTSGKEYISFPLLKQNDPRTYPASEVTVTTTENSMTILYNGISRTYSI